MGKIDVEGICLDFHDQGNAEPVLKDMTFSVKEGEFVSLIGSSGCGKSTTLNIIAGLLAPGSGRVSIDGEEIKGTGKNRGVVFQHYSLFPWMTVRKNVEFGIRQNFPGYSRKELTAKAREYLKQVGLEGMDHKYPYQLSGGMQQRAAIARTLAMEPDILLMDEPFGAIDARNRVILQDLLLDILQKTGKKTIVFVTHDVDEAILMSDRILFMDQGRIKKELTVPFKRPRERERLSMNSDYQHLRRRMVDLFYNDEHTGPAFEGGAGI